MDTDGGAAEKFSDDGDHVNASFLFYFRDMQDDRVSRESVQREEKSRAATTAIKKQANRRSSHWARKQPADSVPAAAVGSARCWSNRAMMLSPVLPVGSLNKSGGAAHVGCSFLN